MIEGRMEEKWTLKGKTRFTESDWSDMKFTKYNTDEEVIR